MNKNIFFCVLEICLKASKPFYSFFFQVIEFFRGKDLGTSKRTVDNTIEVIRMNVDWMARNHVKVSKWFREHGQ